MKKFNKVFAVFTALVFFIYLSASAQSWSPLGSGIDGTINTMTEYNGELYAGGQFVKAGNVTVSNIAKWDGKKWSSVLTGVNGAVYALCVYNNELYVAGYFSFSGKDTMTNISKWNGKTWMPVGKGIYGKVYTMAVYNNELYVAGQFSKVGDIATSNIAKWNGKVWSVVGSGVAKWENNSWNVVGSGINDKVTSLCVYNGSLYACGKFTYAGLTSANYIAKWDGTSWTALGKGGLSITDTSDPYATALAVFNDELYVTGFFNKADSISVNNIVRWNGKNFQTVSSGIEYISSGDYNGKALIVFNGELYVGGIFKNAGSTPTENIAKWNGKTWSSMEIMSNQSIACFGIYKVSLIAGGVFNGDINEPKNIASFCNYATSNFTMSPSFGKRPPLDVKFINANSDSKTNTYFWDFGDETSSKDINPVHTFKAYGNTPVTLFTTSNEGCTSAAIKFITIDTLPPSTSKIISDKNILTVINPKPNESYQWFFNNLKIPGATTTSYTATKTGTYKVLVSNPIGSTSDYMNLVIVDNDKIAYNNLDINNINARFNSEGSMFWNFIDPMYEVPKGSGKSTIFTGAFWIGGYDSGHKLHVAAQTYRRKGTDFWAGPIMKAENYSAAQDSLWNKVWKTSKKDIDYHLAHLHDINYKMPESIANWPGSGNTELGQMKNIAPYVDVNKNGIYDPANGDYPQISGDQAVFFVFNDDRTIHTETHGTKLGIEVHGLAYSFDAPKDSALNNTVFLNYTIINRSKQNYDSVYVGLLTDFDIGNSTDDYIGCDVKLNTFFGYNGDAFDEGIYGYGKTPPAQGVTILNNNLTNFMYYNHTDVGTPVTQDPETAENYYNYMRSLWKDKTHATYGGIGYGGKTPVNFMFNESYGGWNENSAGNKPGDRRGLGSFGPLSFTSGESKSIDIAYITACDYSANMLSVDLLKQRVVKIIDFYKSNIAGK